MKRHSTHTPTGAGDSAAHYRQALERICDVERALLDALDNLTPADSVPDSAAIPFLNSLEARGEAITEAVDLIRNEIESLLSD
jgi:hypothetical protein